jgi:hypothetical protein
LTRDSRDEAHDAIRETAEPAASRDSDTFVAKGSEPPSSRTRARTRESSVVASAVMAPEDSDMPSSSTMTMEAWAALHGARAPGSHAAGAHDECSRMRLIGDLTRLLHESEVPQPVRLAGLTLIGWLARRQPGEAAHALGAPCAEAARARASASAVRSGPSSERSRGKR